MWAKEKGQWLSQLSFWFHCITTVSAYSDVVTISLCHTLILSQSHCVTLLWIGQLWFAWRLVYPLMSKKWWQWWDMDHYNVWITTARLRVKTINCHTNFNGSTSIVCLVRISSTAVSFQIKTFVFESEFEKKYCVLVRISTVVSFDLAQLLCTGW